MLHDVSLGLTLAGGDRKVAGSIGLYEENLPKTFPITIWNDISNRYAEYWRWYRGEYLAQVRYTDTDGEALYKYPLHINSIRQFVRKHATVLFGEAPDTPIPLVRAVASPKLPLDGNPFSEADKTLANIAQNVVNEVWMASNGRSLQQEAGELAQFLGGCVFQVCYRPEKALEMLIPITIRSIRADFFLPIWDNEDYWNLLEAFVVYKISSATAMRQYGIQTDDPNGDVLYMEHWTRETYSITVNGMPVKRQFGDVTIEYKDMPNDFGFVPFVYIPHLREGGAFGTSLVEDVVGVLKEYNARMADTGDAVFKSVQRYRFAANVYTKPEPQDIAPGFSVINLGTTPPGKNDKPEVWSEDSPALSDALVNFNNSLWNQMLREGSLAHIAFGEDEGSQRSALTLAFRMWPVTAHARMERTFWTDGLNRVAKMILRMMVIKPIASFKIDPTFEIKLQFSQDWHPQIPRDREQMVNEVILRSQAGLMSLQKSLETFGDVRNTDDEIELIKEFMTFKAEIASAGVADKAGTTPGSGAPESVVKPIASDGTGEQL